MTRSVVIDCRLKTGGSTVCWIARWTELASRCARMILVRWNPFIQIRWSRGNSKTRYGRVSLKRVVWVLICPLGEPDHPRRDADGCEEKASHEEEFKWHEESVAASPLLTRES